MEVSLGKQILVILILIIANGIFSLLEMAIVSCRKTKLETMAENGNSAAAIVLKLQENPNKMFSMVQFGITVIALLTGVYGGTELVKPLAMYVAQIPFINMYAHIISLVAIIGSITYLSIILGEIVPKRIAIDKPEKIACILARPMLYFSLLCTPIIWFLAISTQFFTKLFGISMTTARPVTEEEIKILLEQGAKLGSFAKEESVLIDRVFRLSDMDASDIMTNKMQIEWLDLDDDDNTIMKEMMSFTHSNLPVGKGSLDEFYGMISIKQVFKTYYELIQNKHSISIQHLLQQCLYKPIYIPESMNIINVLSSFREHSVHAGIVLDEYGNFTGIITLHDILEELVGIMPAGEEEKKEEANKIIQRNDNEWLIDGMVTIEEFKDYFHIMDLLPEEDDDLYKTIAGFIIYGLGRIPIETDCYSWRGFTFEVIDMDHLRVDKVLVTKKS
ncbi:HlyC/CorC family transporter [Veillonellaceae bacterium M2-4]|nr:HlyC/CorC family transporter [Veillonellaceae bacterium M2-4]